MSNFKQDILDIVGDESIEGIVIGLYGWGGDYPCGYGEGPNVVPADKMCVVLSAKEALPWLDYEYSTGFGAPECHAVYAWTTTKVIHVSQYNGSTRLVALPRNPIDCMPLMSGG